MMNEIAIDRQWFVIRVRPMWEKKIEQILRERGLTVYLPIQEQIKQWSDRKKKIQKVLIHGYLFIYCQENERAMIFGTGGVQSYLMAHGKPAIISQRSIDLLKEFEKHGSHIRKKEQSFISGQMAEISSGAFKGYRGYIRQLKTKTIVLIELEGLDYFLEVNTEFDQLKLI